MTSRLHTDVEVFCQDCGKSAGYVVADGHKNWLCDTCGSGKHIALPDGYKTLKDSSLKVEPWEVGDMVVVRHFTGTLLLGQFEARQLLTLLQDVLGDTPPLPIDKARQFVADYDAMVETYAGEK